MQKVKFYYKKFSFGRIISISLVGAGMLSFKSTTIKVMTITDVKTTVR